MNNLLNELRKKYSRIIPYEIKGVSELNNKYKSHQKESIIDLIVIASSLSINIIRDNENHIALLALKKTNPNIDIDNLNNYTDEQLMGIISSAKGKYFELLVVEKLNNGKQVGDLLLAEGYHAKLAESITQPGWDIQITDRNNQIIDYFQLKSSDNISYISEALNKYPDIKILATEEVIGIDDRVISANIDNEEITREIENTLFSQDDTFLENLIDNFNPLLPLAFILATDGYKLVIGNISYNKLFSKSNHRIKRALLTSGVGTTIYTLGGGWLSIPLSLGLSSIYDEKKLFSTLNNNLQKMTEELNQFKKYRQNKTYGIPN